MLAEQAKASAEKNQVKQKAKGRVVKRVLKFSKKHVQNTDTTDEDESVRGHWWRIWSSASVFKDPLIDKG